MMSVLNNQYRDYFVALTCSKPSGFSPLITLTKSYSQIYYNLLSFTKSIIRYSSKFSRSLILVIFANLFQIVNFFFSWKTYSVLSIIGEGSSTSKIKSTK